MNATAPNAMTITLSQTTTRVGELEAALRAAFPCGKLVSFPAEGCLNFQVSGHGYRIRASQTRFTASFHVAGHGYPFKITSTSAAGMVARIQKLLSWEGDA